jgi:hypothetical protein
MQTTHGDDCRVDCRKALAVQQRRRGASVAVFHVILTQQGERDARRHLHTLPRSHTHTHTHTHTFHTQKYMHTADTDQIDGVKANGFLVLHVMR